MKKNTVPSLLLMILLVAFPQISETIYTPSLPDISAALDVSNNVVQLLRSVFSAGAGFPISSVGGLPCWAASSFTASEV